MLQPIILILFLSLSGCGGLPLGTAILANTSGTLVGNYAWSKVQEFQDKKKSVKEAPGRVERISKSELRLRARQLHDELN